MILLFREYKKNLELSIKQLEESVNYIDWKHNFYDEVRNRKYHYINILIKTK